MGGYGPLKDHQFFEDIEWETLVEQTPPKLMPYLPASTKGEQGFRSDINVRSVHFKDFCIMHAHAYTHAHTRQKVGESDHDSEFEDRFLQCFGLGDPDQQRAAQPIAVNADELNSSQRDELLKKQSQDSPW